MKKITLLAVLAFSNINFAQSLETKEIRANMSKGNQPGIEVFIPYVTEDNLEDAIKKVTKKFKGDREKVKKSKEIYLDDAIIKEISENTIDIHQIIEKEGNGIRYRVFFNLGGAFLSSELNPKKFAYADEIVNRIALSASEIRIDDIIEEEEKVLEDLTDDKKDILDDKEDAYKDIEKAKDEIAEKEKEIIDLTKQIETKSTEIEKQSRKLEALKKQKSGIKRM